MPDPRDPQLDDLRRRARRRLVGAVVLALAAAVLVPMLLESDPKPLGEDVAVRIPPIDDGKFVSKVGERAKTDAAPAATPPPAAAKPEPPVEPKEAAKPPAEAPRPAAAAEPATKAPEPKPVPPAAPETSARAPGKDAAAGAADATKAGAFSVQLAAFIDDKGANALAGRLKRAGYPAYTEPYSTSRGTLWRVRVGPYPSRDAAEAARTKLKGDGQNGIITAAK